VTAADPARDRGSGTVEFLFVALVLTALTLGVLQLGLAVYVRNVVHDAAVEGAYVAALADAAPSEGIARTRQIIERSVGEAFAEDVSIGESSALGHSTVEVRVVGTLPVLGMLGVPGALEVVAHAPRESLG
jgi:Flp pilus assembly protein TadG